VSLQDPSAWHSLLFGVLHCRSRAGGLEPARSSPGHRGARTPRARAQSAFIWKGDRSIERGSLTIRNVRQSRTTTAA